MLRLLIVLLVFATSIFAYHQSCSDEPEVIHKNRKNPMQEYYKWKQIEVTPTIDRSRECSLIAVSLALFFSVFFVCLYWTDKQWISCEIVGIRALFVFFFDKLFLVIILHLGHQPHRPSYKSGSTETPNPLSNFAVSAVHYKGRIFMSLPRKQPGVVSTLNYVHANHTIGSSPPLQPYPNLQTNELKVSSDSQPIA